MFNKGIHKRIKIVLLIVLFIFDIIIAKVFYIEVIDYKKLNSLASGLWSRNLPIEADRGNIYTVDGEAIASNLTTTSLVFIPNQIKNKDLVAEKISEILDVPKSKIEEHLYKKSMMERVHPEGRRLSYEIADKIENLHFDGVYLLKESKRYYPHNEMLSHVLGYVGIDNQGLSGLELEYDDILTGEYGSIQYFSDAKGNNLERNSVYVEPEDGLDIYLTVDYGIQSSIERELDNVVLRYNPDGAWAIAMDPNTGEILGMSSRPNFNPNSYKDYDTETINRNMAIWASYEPGSTFKILTLSAAVNEGKVDLIKDTFYDGGSVNVGGARIKCWKHGGHGSQTFLEVVQNSCNPGFVELGNRLGKETLFDYINKFGYGKKTGIDLNGEATGILFSLDKVGPVELATTAFGQGVSVTALQQVVAVSAAINGGTLYKPYIVKRVAYHENGQIIKEVKPTIVRDNIVTKDTSEKVRMTLESVVSLGTGRNAYIYGYRVGGKTGTAQKVNNGIYMQGNYIVSFIGFLPANDPKIVVYLAIDNPKGVTQYGGTVSAPIVKNIMEDAITSLNIEKQDGGTEKKYQWYDKKYYTVPNVVGKSKKEATSMLKSFSVEYSGSGDVVVSQSPDSDSRIAEGEKVRLYLG
ncbi:MAG: stage V sporulation protein D [Bacilli bacterium]|nr:stage V sporulation protein D [Bacilli bacterium]